VKDQETADRLTAEVRGLRGDIGNLRGDVQQERRGRRLSLAAMALAILIGGAVLVDDQRDENADDARQCGIRTESRHEIRSAIDAAVDEVAAYAELTDEERADLRGRVRVRALEELPPPNC
jgi:hypothetical protein